MPPGPNSSKSVLASAAPNCTDATPPNTKSVGMYTVDPHHGAAPYKARERSYAELQRIFADVDAPFAFVDIDRRRGRTPSEMLGRAAGTPIRVASKSVRCSSAARVDPRRAPASGG